MERKVSRYESRDEFVFGAVQTIAEAARRNIREKGVFTIALSGGSTPKPVYDALAQGQIEVQWDKVHVFFSDERAVVPTDPQSNYFMADAALLSRVDIPRKNIHRIPGELYPTEQAARRYEVDLSNFFDLPRYEAPSFDMIMLGIGSDGHTASLFPGHKTLEASRRLVLPTPEPNMYPRVERITFSLPLINKAKHVLFLTSTKDKEDVLDQVLDNADCQLPAAQVKAELVEWLIREK